MNNNHIKELARSRAREILSSNETFKRLPVEEQKQMYLDVVEDEIVKIQREQGGELAAAQAQNRGGLGGLLGGNQKGNNRSTRRKTGGASDLINDDRHEKGFEDGVDAFEDLVDSVDFPLFVKDLLKGVFDANISVMKAQTDDYIRLMKEATTGLAKFIKEVGDDDAAAYAAENSPSDFNILVEDDGDGGEKIALTKPDGEKVEDAELASIMADAKIKMAQEHRAALREMILMGVTRLVVERGEVEAEVNFEFQGKREVKRSDKALRKKDQVKQTQGGFGGGLSGLLGGPSGGHTNTTRKTQFSVSSAKSTQEDELKAKLRGFVNIKFKTDYFKLDNFAQMYAPPTAEQQEAANQQQLPAPRPRTA